MANQPNWALKKNIVLALRGYTNTNTNNKHDNNNINNNNNDDNKDTNNSNINKEGALSG